MDELSSEDAIRERYLDIGMIGNEHTICGGVKCCIDRTFDYTKDDCKKCLEEQKNKL